jgi:phage shock protein A
MSPTAPAEPTLPPIPLSDAHSLIEQMENRIRPFLRVKEVLAAAITAEQLLERMTRTQAQLQTEIDATKAQRDAQQVQADQALTEHTETAAKQQAVASASLDATRAVLAKAQTDLEGLRAAHRTETTQYDEQRAARIRETEALEGQIAALKADLAKLVSRYRVD